MCHPQPPRIQFSIYYSASFTVPSNCNYILIYLMVSQYSSCIVRVLIKARESHSGINVTRNVCQQIFDSLSNCSLSAIRVIIAPPE